MRGAHRTEASPQADEEELKQAKKRRAEDQNALVDILTVDKPTVGSDDDDLFFLPTKPIPDRELEGGSASQATPAGGAQDVSAGITVVEDPAEKQS